MGRKRAIKVLTPPRPLVAGRACVLEVQLRIPHAVEILETSAMIEGRCRASFSGQDCMHSLVSQRLNLPIQPLLVPSTKGCPILPSGSFRLPLPVILPSNLPGTFTAKQGAIAYRVIVKLVVRRVSSSDSAVLETERPVDVIGLVEAESSTVLPVSIDRHVKKKVFCFSRLDAKVNFEVERSSFVVGEHILVNGSIQNEHNSKAIKHVAMELRQKVRYTSGNTERNDVRLICRLICGTVAPASKFDLHHSLQIPNDCYPTLNAQGSPIQVSYDLLITSSGLFEVEAPVFIGNHTGRSSRRSIQYPDSIPDKNSVYYCIPPTEYSYASTDPPPYSTDSGSSKGRPVFIPIHVLNTPHRPFAPVYGMSGFGFPPKYRDQQHSPRFLKIEEIHD